MERGHTSRESSGAPRSLEVNVRRRRRRRIAAPCRWGTGKEVPEEVDLHVDLQGRAGLIGGSDRGQGEKWKGQQEVWQGP